MVRHTSSRKTRTRSSSSFPIRWDVWNFSFSSSKGRSRCSFFLRKKEPQDLMVVPLEITLSSQMYSQEGRAIPLYYKRSWRKGRKRRKTFDYLCNLGWIIIIIIFFYNLGVIPKTTFWVELLILPFHSK